MFKHKNIFKKTKLLKLLTSSLAITSLMIAIPLTSCNSSTDVFRISGASSFSSLDNALPIIQTKNGRGTTKLKISVSPNSFVEIGTGSHANDLVWSDPTNRPIDNNTYVTIYGSFKGVKQDSFNITLLTNNLPGVPTNVIISIPPSVDAFYNIAGSLQLNAKDNFGGNLTNPSWSLVSEQTGLFSITTSGLLSWTDRLNPQVAGGKYTITVKCEASGLVADQKNIDINVKTQPTYDVVPFAMLNINNSNVLTGYTGNISNYGKLVLPSNVTSIGDNAFINCTSLKILDLSTLTTGSIGSSAFAGCSSVETVNFSNYNGFIDSYVFSSCTSLFSINLSSLTTQMGPNVFRYCTSLETVNLSSYNGFIGTEMFEACTSLRTVNLSSLTTGYIGKEAFNECISLQTINLSSLTTGYIGQDAFAGCRSLHSLDISGLTTGTIDDSAFYGCSSLLYSQTKLPQNLDASSDYQVVDNMSTGKLLLSKTNKIVVGGLAIGSFTWSELYTPMGGSIRPQAFVNCASLTSLDLSTYYNVSIGYYAFYGCSSLETVNSICEAVGEGAFADCTSLTSITFNDNNGDIGDYAFVNCTALKTVTFTGSFPCTVGADAFEGCSSLEKLYMSVLVYPGKLDNFAFKDCTSLNEIHVILDQTPSWGAGCFANTSSTGTIYKLGDMPNDAVMNYFVSQLQLKSTGWTIVNQE